MYVKKQTALCTCNGVLLSLQKEGNSDAGCNTDEPGNILLSEVSQIQKSKYNYNLGR